MMNQQQLIQRFKEQFPTWTFKQIAQKTGLNTSRVFRLFNGQEMKVSEYMAIERLLDRSLLEQKVLLCSDKLPPEQLEKISSVMERYLDSYLLTHDAHGYYSKQRHRSVS